MENNENTGSDCGGADGASGHRGCPPNEQPLELTILVDTATRSIVGSSLALRPPPTWAAFREAFRMGLSELNTEPSAEAEGKAEPGVDANAGEPEDTI